MTSEQNSPFIERPEICEQLGIHPRTLMRLVKQGTFPPPIRLNLKKHVWMRSHIESFFQEAAEAGHISEV